jgi:hypothetical protein
LPDGKTWDAHHGDIELTLFVDEDVEERFKKLVQSNAESFAMPGEVEFV